MTAANLRRFARALEDFAESVRDIAGDVDAEREDAATMASAPQGAETRVKNGQRAICAFGHCLTRTVGSSAYCAAHTDGGERAEGVEPMPDVQTAVGPEAVDEACAADPHAPARPLDAPPLLPTCVECGDFETDHHATLPWACKSPGCDCGSYKSSTPLPRLADGARDPRDNTPCNCVSCGKPVEEARLCYARPTCYACLPPLPPLEIAPARSSIPTNVTLGRTRRNPGVRDEAVARAWYPSVTSIARANLPAGHVPVTVAAYLASCPVRHVKPGDRDFVRWVRERAKRPVDDAAKAHAPVGSQAEDPAWDVEGAGKAGES